MGICIISHMICTHALVCFRYSIWIVSTHFASPQMSFRWAVSSWMVCHGCPICYMICLGKYIRGYGMLFHPWTCNTKHTHLGRSLSIMEQSRGLGGFRAYSYPCSAGFLLWHWTIVRFPHCRLRQRQMVMDSQITGQSSVCSTICADWKQRKIQGPRPFVRVTTGHRWIPRTNGQ